MASNLKYANFHSINTVNTCCGNLWPILLNVYKGYVNKGNPTFKMAQFFGSFAHKLIACYFELCNVMGYLW